MMRIPIDSTLDVHSYDPMNERLAVESTGCCWHSLEFGPDEHTVEVYNMCVNSAKPTHANGFPVSMAKFEGVWIFNGKPDDADLDSRFGSSLGGIYDTDLAGIATGMLFPTASLDTRKLTVDSFQRRVPEDEGSEALSHLSMIKFVTQSARLADCSNLCTVRGRAAEPEPAPRANARGSQPDAEPRHGTPVKGAPPPAPIAGDSLEPPHAEDSMPIATMNGAMHAPAQQSGAPAKKNMSDAKLRQLEQVRDLIMQMSEADVEVSADAREQAAAQYADNICPELVATRRPEGGDAPTEPAHDTDRREYLYFDDEILRRLEDLGWNRKLGFTRLIPMVTCCI